ncbi:MAG: heme-binding protein, partial [Phycisphaerae bacterium]|nr:heme-binding protein [Phycisphaerae bacterium]
KHIKRNDIAMTAPVEIEYAASSEPIDTGAGRRGQQHATSMAFMYAAPNLGATGPDPADGRVAVEDIPAMTVLSIGVRGGYTEKNFAAALAKLNDWLDHSLERFRVVGPPRYLAYNSPFVPWFLKFGEVQLRVERIE